MGFRLGEIADPTEAGRIKGIQREIACDCWFTSRGRSIPKMIKIMDEEGMIHTINEIQILCSEEKTYSGIHTVEHVCRIVLGEYCEIVKLIYTKENCRWVLVKS